MNFSQPYRTGKRKALFVAVVLYAVQVVAGYHVWDSEGFFRYTLLCLLCVIQFPIFELVLISIILPLDWGTVDVRAYFFATYLLKFYAISLAYSILVYHVLRGRHWRLYKFALYLLLECLLLMLTMIDSYFTMIDSKFPAPRWRLAPIEIAFTFWLYRFVDRHFGCAGNK